MSAPEPSADRVAAVPIGSVATLLVWQWGLTLGALGVIIGVARVPWGAWLPLGVYLLGTLLWGLSSVGREATTTRALRKAVSVGAGWRGAVGLGAGFLALRLAWPDGLSLPLGGALGVALLIAGVGTPILTALTLVGLDAAVRDHPASSSSERSGGI